VPDFSAPEYEHYLHGRRQSAKTFPGAVKNNKLYINGGYTMFGTSDNAADIAAQSLSPSTFSPSLATLE
jgi:hypothetical protein